MIRIYGNVFTAVYKWRKKASANRQVLINVMQGKHISSYPSVSAAGQPRCTYWKKLRKG